MSDSVSEQEKVKKQFKEHAKATGLCESFRVFNLGSHGTVYVGCGLVANHGSPESDEDVYFTKHQSAQTEEDGAMVIFQWPV